MIIDPGADAREILRVVDELGLKIKVIALTHSHMDHVGALREVKEATGAEIAIHTDEAKFLQRQPQRGMFNPFSQPIPSPDRLVKEGDTIDIGNLHFRVLHTPGHTPGGMCLLEEGIVFCGDTLFNFGIGRADFPGASYDQEIESIRTKLMTLPDDTVVCPGHGPDTKIGVERGFNPFL
jgi:hydroxyacylglutathione hydrolase